MILLSEFYIYVLLFLGCCWHHVFAKADTGVKACCCNKQKSGFVYNFLNDGLQLENNRNFTSSEDIFRKITNHSDVIQTIETLDKGYYTSLCWSEIITIHEKNNGSKSVIHEYAITFETQADIPEKYLKSNKSQREEYKQYKIYDQYTKKSQIVNFTTVSQNDDGIVRESRKMFCGSGPIYTAEFIKWPQSDHKRFEIKVSPRRHDFVLTNLDEFRPTGVNGTGINNSVAASIQEGTAGANVGPQLTDGIPVSIQSDLPKTESEGSIAPEKSADFNDNVDNLLSSTPSLRASAEDHNSSSSDESTDAVDKSQLEQIFGAAAVQTPSRHDQPNGLKPSTGESEKQDHQESGSKSNSPPSQTQLAPNKALPVSSHHINDPASLDSYEDEDDDLDVSTSKPNGPKPNMGKSLNQDHREFSSESNQHSSHTQLASSEAVVVPLPNNSHDIDDSAPLDSYEDDDEEFGVSTSKQPNTGKSQIQHHRESASQSNPPSHNQFPSSEAVIVPLPVSSHHINDPAPLDSYEDDDEELGVSTSKLNWTKPNMGTSREQDHRESASESNPPASHTQLLPSDSVVSFDSYEDDDDVSTSESNGTKPSTGESKNQDLPESASDSNPLASHTQLVPSDAVVVPLPVSSHHIDEESYEDDDEGFDVSTSTEYATTIANEQKLTTLSVSLSSEEVHNTTAITDQPLSTQPNPISPLEFGGTTNRIGPSSTSPADINLSAGGNPVNDSLKNLEMSKNSTEIIVPRNETLALTKDECPKQKIVIQVRLQLKHIVDSLDPKVAAVNGIPIMGVEKQIEIPIDAIRETLVVPDHAINLEWYKFLDDLGKHFFVLHKDEVTAFTNVINSNLKLNESALDFGNFLLPNDTMERLERIKANVNICKENHKAGVNAAPQFRFGTEPQLAEPLHRPNLDFYNYLLPSTRIENHNSGSLLTPKSFGHHQTEQPNPTLGLYDRFGLQPQMMNDLQWYLLNNNFPQSQFPNSQKMMSQKSNLLPIYSLIQQLIHSAQKEEAPQIIKELTPNGELANVLNGVLTRKR